MQTIGVHTINQTVRVAELHRIGGAVRAVRLMTLPLVSPPGAASSPFPVVLNEQASAHSESEIPNLKSPISNLRSDLSGVSTIASTSQESRRASNVPCAASL